MDTGMNILNLQLKQGSLIFQTTLFADFLYIVKEVRGEKVIAKKMDAPPNVFEEIPISQITKLADEQERFLPYDLMDVIQKQREVIFSTPKNGVKKKRKKGIERLLADLPKEAEEDILRALGDLAEKQNLLADEEEEGGETNE